MYPANRSFLAVLGALALGLAVPTSVLAQEDPDAGDEPKVEKTAHEQAAPKAEAEKQEAEAQPKAEAQKMAETRPMSDEGESLVAVAKTQGNLTRFVALLDEAGLASELSEGGPFTIFAPTDDAFTALEQDGAIEELDAKELRRLIRTHIAMGEWTSEELTGADEITNLLADELPLAWTGQDGETEAMRQVDGADVVRADIVAGNGVIHEIDAVLTASPSSDMSASLETVDSADEPESTEASGTGAGN